MNIKKIFKWPFLQKYGLGLDLQKDKIQGVWLSKIGREVTLVKVFEVSFPTNIEFKPHQVFEDNGVPEQPVAIGLDSKRTRFLQAGVPPREDEEERLDWIRERIQENLPPCMRVDNIVFRENVSGEEDGELLTCYYSRINTVEETARLMQGKGVRCSLIAPAELAWGYACLFNDDFAEGWSALIVADEQNSFLLIYRNGIINARYAIAQTMEQPLAFLQEIETNIRTFEYEQGQKATLKQVFVTKNDHLHGDTLKHFREKLEIDRNYIIVSPLDGIGNEGEGELKPKYFGAAGLAVRQLLPELDPFNFLSSDIVIKYQQEEDRNDFINTARMAGGITFILILIVFLTQLFFESRLGETKQQYQKVTDRISAITEAENKIEVTRSKLINMQHLISEKTKTSKIMSLVGRSVPDQVWLTELVIQNSDSLEQVSIEGFTEKEHRITRYLANLEKIELMEGVHLSYTEITELDERQAKKIKRGKSVISFKIECEIENPHK